MGRMKQFVLEKETITQVLDLFPEHMTQKDVVRHVLGAFITLCEQVGHEVIKRFSESELEVIRDAILNIEDADSSVLAPSMEANKHILRSQLLSAGNEDTELLDKIEDLSPSEVYFLRLYLRNR